MKPISPLPEPPLSPHAITLASARSWRLCTRRHPTRNVEDYDAARTFDLRTAHSPDITALEKLLCVLLQRPYTCVLHRGVRDSAGVRGVRRLLHPDRLLGETASLAGAVRSWLALDLNGIPLLDSVCPHDLPDCGTIVRAYLPLSFFDGACIINATAGRGYKPGPRLQPCFLMSRPLTALFWVARRAGEIDAAGGLGPEIAASTQAQASMEGGRRNRRNAEATLRDGFMRRLVEAH